MTLLIGDRGKRESTEASLGKLEARESWPSTYCKEPCEMPQTLRLQVKDVKEFERGFSCRIHTCNTMPEIPRFTAVRELHEQATQ